MVTSKNCLDKYGKPKSDNPCMILWDVPADLEIGVIPKKIWCNKDLIEPLKKAFINLISRGYAESELKTWDGCFNIRPMRGTELNPVWSLHSWGIAIDINAFENSLGTKGKMSKGMVECFTDAGFKWGGNFKNRKDPMHFELENI